MNVYYRIAKKFRSILGEGYTWYTPTLDQGTTQRYAFELNKQVTSKKVNSTPGYQPSFLVFGASSAERLDYMLEQYCAGRPACYAEVQDFLIGRLDESHVERWEYEHGGIEARSVSLEEYMKADSAWVQSIMRDVVERVFNQEAPPDEPPASTEEEEGEEPPTGPIKCPRLPKGGKKRAEFYKWMVKTGRMGGSEDGA